LAGGISSRRPGGDKLLLLQYFLPVLLTSLKDTVAHRAFFASLENSYFPTDCVLAVDGSGIAVVGGAAG